MLAVAALPLIVAACGSSSGGSTGASTSTGSTTTPNLRTAAGRAQIAACLKKQGVTLPQGPQGAGAPPGGAPGGGAPGGGGGGGFLFGGGGNGGGNGSGGPPGGGNFRNSKFAAALRKCGVTPGQGGGRPSGGGIQNNPRFKQAITKFVACMKKNGYALPKPNLSGNGPVFDSSKVNRNDPKFQSAAQKCQNLLRPGAQPGATT